jgi:signal transduction histidine kinase
MGLAAGLPLLLLVGGVILFAYRASSEQTYATVEQTSLRYAAQFESRLNEKLGLLRGLVAVRAFDDALASQRLMAIDSDLKAIWTHLEGQSFVHETPQQRDLYEQVRAHGREVLSEPDFAKNQAALGLPIFDDGVFSGMVAVYFSLDYFQGVVQSLRLYTSGYSVLISSDGYRIAHPRTELIGTRVGNDVPAEASVDMLAKVKAGRAFWFDKKAQLTGKWSRQYYSPIKVGEAANPWILDVVVPAEEATFNLDSLFFVLMTGSFSTLLLVAAATWRTTRKLILPLRELAANAEAIAHGDLDAKVRVTSNDEFGTVAAAFNRMTDQLVSTLRDQERLVRERTASLETSLAELEQAHEKIVASEKLAVLGQLTATIAHEVNTPLGAIRSSANFLSQALNSRIEALPVSMTTITSENTALYQRLVKQRGVGLRYSEGGSERKRRRDLTAKLKAAGVSDAEATADDIVFLVPQEDEPELLSLVVAGKGGVIHVAAQSAAMAQSGAIILEAADRAASTVSALVNYTRMSDLGAEETIDPAQELETILAIYYGPTKKGVEIVKDFQPGILLRGDRDKLSHVWVNLMNNALQAMNYRGRLLLRIRGDEEQAQISFANNGPPIPAELKEKIFLPFFTTKRMSEGTGLGLDICRRIVTAHHGTIGLSEENELTVFTITLPRAQGTPQ